MHDHSTRCIQPALDGRAEAHCHHDPPTASARQDPDNQMHSLSTRSMAGRKPISSSWSASSSTCAIMAHEETGFAPTAVKDPRPEVAACEDCCCGHASPAPNQHSQIHPAQRRTAHQGADTLQLLRQPRVLQVVNQAAGGGHKHVAAPAQPVALAVDVGATCRGRAKE